MQILIIVGQLSLGGTEKHLASVVPKLKTLGFDIAIFSFRGGGELIKDIEREGVRVFVPPVQIRGFIGLPFIAASLIKTVLMNRPAIVHYFLPEAYLLGMCSLVFFPNMIHVLSRRSLNIYQKRRWFAGRIERILHRRLSYALANSKAVVDDLINEGIPSTRISLIYNGVGSERSSADKSILSRKNDSQSKSQNGIGFVIVGNLIPYKGHLDLLEALALVSQNDRINWRLEVVGGDSSNIAANLIRRAEQLQISHRISWLGTQINPQPFIEKADVGIIASHEEGFSNALLEYMHAGLAIVATNVGGNAEALKGGEAGILVEPRDHVALADAITKLSTDEKLRSHFGLIAQQRAIEEFSIENCIAEYEKFYRNVIS